MHVFSASATLDNSPPEAIFSSGFGSSPTFGEINISTASAPDSDHAVAVTRISTLVFSIASDASSCSTRLANCRAASFRTALNFADADSYSAASRATSLRRPSRLSLECSTAASCMRTSSRNTSTSSTLAPYLRFNFSSAARRDSTSSNLPGSASSFAR